MSDVNEKLPSAPFATFFTVTDPCSANQLKNGKDPAVRAANCAALGIPAGWQSTRTSTVQGLSGSNPDLKPENGRTWTAGMVITPRFLDGFGVTLDYWNIKLSNAITAPSGTDIAGFPATFMSCVNPMVWSR